MLVIYCGSRQWSSQLEVDNKYIFGICNALFGMNTFTLCIASTNQGKISEIQQFLQHYTSTVVDIQWVSLLDFPDVPAPEEPFVTFIDNAKHKAKYYAQCTQLPTLSEDAGLEVDALDGFPGVQSKRFLSACGGIQPASAELKNRLFGLRTSARFVCESVIFFPNEKSESDNGSDFFLHARGDMRGHLIFPGRGESGFGYDSIFVPDGYMHTISELGMEIKSKISHRTHALKKIFHQLMSKISIY